MCPQSSWAFKYLKLYFNLKGLSSLPPSFYNQLFIPKGIKSDLNKNLMTEQSII